MSFSVFLAVIVPTPNLIIKIINNNYLPGVFEILHPCLFPQYPLNLFELPNNT